MQTTNAFGLFAAKQKVGNYNDHCVLQNKFIEIFNRIESNRTIRCKILFIYFFKKKIIYFTLTN